MKKLIQISLVLCLSVFAFQAQAQTAADMDTRKVYVSYDTPTNGVNTYQFLVTNSAVNKKLQADASYGSRLQSKFVGKAGITQMTVAPDEKLATVQMNSGQSNIQVLRVLKEMNKNLRTIVQKQ